MAFFRLGKTPTIQALHLDSNESRDQNADNQVYVAGTLKKREGRDLPAFWLHRGTANNTPHT